MVLIMLCFILFLIFLFLSISGYNYYLRIKHIRDYLPIDKESLSEAELALLSRVTKASLIDRYNQFRNGESHCTFEGQIVAKQGSKLITSDSSLHTGVSSAWRYFDCLNTGTFESFHIKERVSSHKKLRFISKTNVYERSFRPIRLGEVLGKYEYQSSGYTVHGRSSADQHDGVALSFAANLIHIDKDTSTKTEIMSYVDRMMANGGKFCGNDNKPIAIGSNLKSWLPTCHTDNHRLINWLLLDACYNKRNIDSLQQYTKRFKHRIGKGIFTPFGIRDYSSMFLTFANCLVTFICLNELDRTDTIDKIGKDLFEDLSLMIKDCCLNSQDKSPKEYFIFGLLLKLIGENLSLIEFDDKTMKYNMNKWMHFIPPGKRGSDYIVPSKNQIGNVDFWLGRLWKHPYIQCKNYLGPIFVGVNHIAFSGNPYVYGYPSHHEVVYSGIDYNLIYSIKQYLKI